MSRIQGKQFDPQMSLPYRAYQSKGVDPIRSAPLRCLA